MSHDDPRNPEGAPSGALPGALQPGEVNPRNGQEFPKVGTAEWEAMNRRRALLIRKKVREGLTAEELAEYEWLQAKSHAELERAFPRPPLAEDRLDRLEARLRAAERNPE